MTFIKRNIPDSSDLKQFNEKKHLPRYATYFVFVCFEVSILKPARDVQKETGIILRALTEKNFADEVTISRGDFEQQFLESKGQFDQIIKQLTFHGDFSKNLKAKMLQKLYKNIVIRNHQIVLRNMKNKGHNPIDDEVFKQAAVAPVNATLGIGKLRKQLQEGMEMENLFEKNFEAIYEKDFKNKREENFDYIQSSGEEDSFLEEIKGSKSKRIERTRVEVVHDDDHLFYEMEKKQRENAALHKKDWDRGLAEYGKSLKINQVGVKSFYERIKIKGVGDTMFLKITADSSGLLSGALRLEVYRPFQRHMVFYEVRDTHIAVSITKK